MFRKRAASLRVHWLTRGPDTQKRSGQQANGRNLLSRMLTMEASLVTRKSSLCHRWRPLPGPILSYHMTSLNIPYPHTSQLLAKGLSHHVCPRITINLHLLPFLSWLSLVSVLHSLLLLPLFLLNLLPNSISTTFKMTTFHVNSSKDRLLAPSFRSSRPASVMTTDSIDTIMIGKPAFEQRPGISVNDGASTSAPAARRSAGPQPYRGFPSQEAYLQAMRDWVESKMYFESDVQLRGFYGTKDMEYYRNKPGFRSHKRGKDQRRHTVVKVPSNESTSSQDGSDTKRDRTLKERAKGVFGRRATIV